MKIIRLGLHPPSRIRSKFDLSHLGNDAIETLLSEGLDLLKRRDLAAAKRWAAGEAMDLQIETLCQTAAGADIALALVNQE